MDNHYTKVALVLLVLLIPATASAQSCDTTNPDGTCLKFDTKIGITTFFFTAKEFGKEVKKIDEYSSCVGYVVKGYIRYFTNGTAPSSVVGNFYSAIPSSNPGNPPQPPNLVLNGREQIMLFKATQANGGGGTISWSCNMNQHPDEYYKQ